MAYRIEAVKDGGELHTFANIAKATAPAKAVKVKVTKETAGDVTWIQKLQGYYKSLVALIAAVLVILNEATPLAGFLPAGAQHWFNVVVVALGAVSTLLVKNQNWVNSL